MRLLFVGDVVGSPGRAALRALLPDLRARHEPDWVVVNGENVAGGLGITPPLAHEMLDDLGVDALTLGNHAYRHREMYELLRAGLLALGFTVTSLVARVIRGRAPDAPAYAIHMVLRVDLPEGPFLADVGYGSLTPTAPLAVRPNVEQTTPHETMRLVPAGEELTLQAKLGEDWENIYRLLPQPRLDTDYEIANWFTATHPNSQFVNNLIAARPGPGGVRNTLFNGRLTVRCPPDQVTRRMLEGAAEYGEVLTDIFGLVLSGAELSAALGALDCKGRHDAVHPFF